MKLKNLITRFDWTLLLACILLCLIGISSIYSSSTNFNISEASLSNTAYFNQILFIVISVFLVLIVAVLRIDQIINFSILYYTFTTFLLILTLFIGKTINNAKSWIDLGVASFQPAELSKITLILTLSFYFSRIETIKTKHILISLILTAIPAILILLQPDLGTVLVYIFIWFVVAMSTNWNNKSKGYFLGVIITMLVILAVLMRFGIVNLEEYQKERINVYPEHLFLSKTNHSDIGYQVDQSLIAVGSGKILGKGLGQGTQTQLGFLPEPKTDFIFSSIAEELGVISVLTIFLLYIYIFWRIYMISTLNIPTAIYFTIVGITSMVSIHIIQNVGMNIGMTPVTGIPMPFISLGGSFLVTCFLSIGLIEGIYLRYKSQ